jgi:hypothetical protein
LAVAVVISLSPVAAAAQDDDQFLRLRSVAPPGEPVRVIDLSGNETTGRLLEVRPLGLRLLKGNHEMEMSRRDIAEVRKNGDPLWNGAALGAAFGAALTVNFLNQASCQTCGAWEKGSVWLFLGGGGAGLGALFDYMRRDDSLLYRRPSRAAASMIRVAPAVRPGGGGLTLSWRF